LNRHADAEFVDTPGGAPKIVLADRMGCEILTYVGRRRRPAGTARL
jgi:hypothetical protein